MVVIHYFGENVTEFGRLEKLSRMECHNVTNVHISINFEKKSPRSKCHIKGWPKLKQVKCHNVTFYP
jgi:hypothetical protein